MGLGPPLFCPRARLGMVRLALEELGARERSLDETLATTRGDSKRATLQLRDDKKPATMAWSVVGFLLHAALNTYSLAGYVFEPSVVFLKNSGRQWHWPEKSDEELALMIEDAPLHVDLDDFARLTDHDDPSVPDAMKKGVSIVEQRGIVVWTRGLNNDQGVSPSTISVLQRLEQKRRRPPESICPAAVGGSAESMARMRRRR